MAILGRREQSRAPILRWSQEMPGYRDGPFGPQYGECVKLVDEAEDIHDEAATDAERQQRHARWLTGATIVLSAAAGITVIPHGIARYVTAVIAFAAAIAAGLAAHFAPARKAQIAEHRKVGARELRDDVKALARRIQDAEAGAASEAQIERELRSLQGKRESIGPAGN